MNNSVKKIESANELLKNLESENKYVFHGSEVPNLEFLEPRQAYKHKENSKEPDGEPAVFASSSVDYAIMMALINKKNCPKGYHSSASANQKGNSKVKLSLKATKNSIEQLKDNSVGYVYVFNKDLFINKNNMGVEYISKISVNPVNIIKVSKSDLPSSIEITEN